MSLLAQCFRGESPLLASQRVEIDARTLVSHREDADSLVVSVAVGNPEQDFFPIFIRRELAAVELLRFRKQGYGCLVIVNSGDGEENAGLVVRNGVELPVDGREVLIEATVCQMLATSAAMSAGIP